MKCGDALDRIDGVAQDAARRLQDTTDTTGVQKPARDALAYALSVYSQIVPRQVSQTVSSGVDGKILTSALTNFDESFLDWLQIEWPIITQGRPSYIDRGGWILSQEDGGQSIRFVRGIPATGDPIRLVHCYPHTVPDDAEAPLTVKASDIEAVIRLAAGDKLQTLANFYTQSTDRPQSAEGFAGFGTKSGEYAKRAAEQRGMFWGHINVAYSKGAGSVRLLRG